MRKHYLQLTIKFFGLLSFIQLLVLNIKKSEDKFPEELFTTA